MNTQQAILTRRSCRKFVDKPIESEKLHQLLQAAMSGPSWVIDGAIAAQNICLAAQELGLGAVWLGTWPQMDRVQAQQKLFALPEYIVPHSVLALGYPAIDLTSPREDRYEENRVHFEQW